MQTNSPVIQPTFDNFFYIVKIFKFIESGNNIMANCYLCGRNIKTPKHAPDGKYICERCYYRDMLKKKLKIWR
jgi:formylmethanofuran dehydrogenase subunit E